MLGTQFDDVAIAYSPAAISGSRPGALIATAWASLVHLGEAGFLDATRRILEGRDALIRGSSELLPELVSGRAGGGDAWSVTARRCGVLHSTLLVCCPSWRLGALAGLDASSVTPGRRRLAATRLLRSLGSRSVTTGCGVAHAHTALATLAGPFWLFRHASGLAVPEPPTS